MDAWRPRAVRLEAGAEVRSSIEALVREHRIGFADVTGFGELESVELAGQRDGEVVALKGPLQLLDLRGRIRRAGDLALFDLVCTLARVTDSGIQLLGGKLQSGRAVFLELTLQPLDPQALAEPAPRPAPPAPIMVPPETPEPPVSRNAPEPPVSRNAADDRWAGAIAESERIEREFRDSGPADLLPQRGDLVNHRQFGQCAVVRIGDDHITLRKPDRRNVQLGLAILRFTLAGGDGEQRIFDVEVRRDAER